MLQILVFYLIVDLKIYIYYWNIVKSGSDAPITSIDHKHVLK
jgi:hypothetical protein